MESSQRRKISRRAAYLTSSRDATAQSTVRTIWTTYLQRWRRSVAPDNRRRAVDMAPATNLVASATQVGFSGDFRDCFYKLDWLKIIIIIIVYNARRQNIHHVVRKRTEN